MCLRFMKVMLILMEQINREHRGYTIVTPGRFDENTRWAHAVIRRGVLSATDSNWLLMFYEFIKIAKTELACECLSGPRRMLHVRG